MRRTCTGQPRDDITMVSLRSSSSEDPIRCSFRLYHLRRPRPLSLPWSQKSSGKSPIAESGSCTDLRRHVVPETKVAASPESSPSKSRFLARETKLSPKLLVNLSDPDEIQINLNTNIYCRKKIAQGLSTVRL